MNEYTIVIDSLRTVELRGPTETGSIVLSVEDPHTVAVVEVPAAEARELLDKLTAMIAKEDA